MGRYREENMGNCTLILGDCLELLASLKGVDVVATDPPYGVDFAEWDCEIPNWLPLAKGLCERIVFTTAPTSLWDYPPADWVACWARPGSTARNAQGGFNHWTPIVAYGVKFPTDMLYLPPVANLSRREYPPGYPHPSPKPLGVMRWIVSAASEPAEKVCDPFMGSGTAGVACIQLSRAFVGIEQDETYFDLACRRIETELKQPRLFPEFNPRVVQTVLDGFDAPKVRSRP